MTWGKRHGFCYPRRFNHQCLLRPLSYERCLCAHCLLGFCLHLVSVRCIFKRSSLTKLVAMTSMHGAHAAAVEPILPVVAFAPAPIPTPELLPAPLPAPVPAPIEPGLPIPAEPLPLPGVTCTVLQMKETRYQLFRNAASPRSFLLL